MRKALTLLLAPALLLASCGEQKVSYDEYYVVAKEADKNAQTVVIEKKTVDGKGNIVYEGTDCTFSFFEEYKLEGQELKLDQSTAKYECNNVFFFLSIGLLTASIMPMKASDAKSSSDQTYTVNPLSVSSNEADVEFDRYGFVTKYTAKKDDSKFTLSISYTYRQVQ